MIRCTDMRQKEVAITISFIYTLISIFVFEHLALANNIKNNSGCLDDHEILIRNHMIVHWKKEVKLIKLDCGEICDTSINAELAHHTGKVLG